ncbi:MAG: hypothetical protein JRI85_10895 [Deltaproteobacteria bacterium]|nr:hypothetical protein [Deltaproteobacteria bacterium]
MDEFFRAIYGMIWCWPALRITQRVGLKALSTAVTITLWMIPGWWIYRLIIGLL